MFELAAISAFAIYFIHACTWPGMIFSFVDKSLGQLPAYLRKPLYDCPTCMTVWWSPVIIALYICNGGTAVQSNFEFGACVFCAAGINAVLSRLIKKKCKC